MNRPAMWVVSALLGLICVGPLGCRSSSPDDADIGRAHDSTSLRVAR